MAPGSDLLALSINANSVGIWRPPTGHRKPITFSHAHKKHFKNFYFFYFYFYLYIYIYIYKKHIHMQTYTTIQTRVDYNIDRMRCG